MSPNAAVRDRPDSIVRPPIPGRALRAGYGDGDPAAVGAVYDEHVSSVYALALLLVGPTHAERTVTRAFVDLVPQARRQDDTTPLLQLLLRNVWHAGRPATGLAA